MACLGLSFRILKIVFCFGKEGEEEKHMNTFLQKHGKKKY